MEDNNKLVAFTGGKPTPGPRSGTIQIHIPDLDSPQERIQVATDGQMTTPEVVYALMTAVTSLTVGIRQGE